jgi:hypothetical protein
MPPHYELSGSALFPPLVFSEINFRGGIEGVIRSPRFKDFPPLIFQMPPVIFSTHQMDGEGMNWTMTIRQKTAQSRVKLKLYNEDKFGFRIRLQAGRYQCLEDIFIAAAQGFVLEDTEMGLMKSTPRERIVIKETVRVERVALDIDTILAEWNENALIGLGDWRPGKPDMKNVINFQEAVEKIYTKEVVENTVDISELIAGLG